MDMGEGDSGDAGDSGDGDTNNNGDDSSDGMTQDAPLTTGALTAGGDSDNDDNNDDDSEGNSNNNNDNNDDSEPKIEDAPATTDALTARKCPNGQEVTLFSASCKPVGTDSTGGASSDANSCPAIAPTSYNDPREMQWSLLYRVADEDVPAGTDSNQDTEGFGTFGKQPSGTSQSDPCPSGGDEPISETRERLPDGGSKTTRTNQDGTSVVTILNLNGVRNPEGNLVPGAVEQDTKYNAQNKPIKTDSYDRSQNVVSTTAYDPKTGNPTYTTNFAPNGDTRSTAAYSFNGQNKLTQVFHLDPQNNLLDRTVNTYTPNNLPRASTTYDSNNQPTSKIVYAGGNTPLSETYYVDGKPISVTRYDENGKTIGTFGPDGKPLDSSPATSTTTATPPDAK
jgi:hypothetical protein